METILNAVVKTNQKEFKIAYDTHNQRLLLWVKEVPKDNKANKEIIKQLKKFFATDIAIVFGLTSSKKKIKISLSKQVILERLANTNSFFEQQ